MAKVDYGAVALIPVGDYSASRQYHANELVGYQGSSYIALQNPPVGTLPTNTTYFMLHTEGTSIATASTPGTVKPDGTSTVVDANGAMSVKPSILQTIQDTSESAEELASKIGNVPTGKTLQAQIDGLEPRVSSSEQALTVNMLNPTLESQTKNGITVTRNADNTYTINGTATENTYLTAKTFTATKTTKVRAIGCPQGGTGNTFYTAVTKASDGTGAVLDFGSGITKELSAGETYRFLISIKSGAVCDNLVFKPMLTTNLSATYDDYVPYSGSSGKLDTDYKALSDKIGNVGNTDLQSQINAATQSIAQNTANVAQNTTDIAANTADISSLNTGLTTKIGTYNDDVSRPVDQIVMNFQNEELVLHDKDVNNWIAIPTFTKTYNATDSLVVLDPNFTLTFAYLARYGHVCTLIIHGKFSANTPDTTAVLRTGGVVPAPCMTAICTAKDGVGNITTLSIEPDGNFRLWGAARANSNNLYPFYFTYLTGNPG